MHFSALFRKVIVFSAETSAEVTLPLYVREILNGEGGGELEPEGEDSDKLPHKFHIGEFMQISRFHEFAPFVGLSQAAILRFLKSPPPNLQLNINMVFSSASYRKTNDFSMGRLCLYEGWLQYSKVWKIHHRAFSV